MLENEISEENIEQLIKQLGNRETLAKLVEDIHTADLVEVVEKRLNQNEQRQLFQSLEAETAAEILVELSDDIREYISEELPSKQLSQMVQEMDSDDAADFVGDIPQSKADEILNNLPIEDSAEVRLLLQYPEESAGGLMQVELIALKDTQTCADAMEEVRDFAKEEDAEELHYVFVTDSSGKLVGVIPLATLVVNSPTTSIKELMEDDPVSISVMADQEEVAHAFRKYDIVSLAVVDAEKRLLGRILHDDVLDVMTETTTEDILKVAGTDEDEFDSSSWITAVRHRLPWLLSSLAGGTLMATIIDKLGTPLEQVIALAAFIPVITGMSGNVSTQSSAIVVRAMVLGKIKPRDIPKYLLKELRVGAVMATVCGFLIAFIGGMLYHNSGIGIIVGLSMFFSMGTAAMLGFLIPIVLQKLNQDPVLGAGPIVLTAVDITAIIIYFLISGSLLHLAS